jgi:ribulose-phosphate 3-epimerase
MSDPSVLSRLKSMVPTISVGVLTADLMQLGSETGKLDGTGVEILHFDVMDGCFCPMMTVGPPFIKGFVADRYLKDVHLMIDDPLDKVGQYVAVGADILTFHIECGNHVHRVVQSLSTATNANDSDRGLVRGIALNPGTPIGALEPVLDLVDMVTVLGINPGWGGQSMIPSTRGRIDAVRELASRAGRNPLVCVDGGVTRKNIEEIATWGADLVVTGSAVFDGRAVADNARFMLHALREGRGSI